jgi:mannose-6-phosphate isomerase-like protein (cupin superfamily)
VGALLGSLTLGAFVLGRVSAQEADKPLILSLSGLLEKNPPAKDEAFKILPAVQGRDASVTVVRAEKDLPPHYHEGREEIVYVVRGGGTMQIGDEKRPVKAGDIVYIPRHVVHGFSNGAKRDTVVVSVMAPPFDGKDRIFVQPSAPAAP